MKRKTDPTNKSQEELLQERINGKLPIVDIAGHPFYVDLRMGMLRPKDDFHTLGIPIKAFDDFEGPDGFIWLPYNPKKHELKVVDIDRLKEIPKDWIIIELPFIEKLDPYAYARDQGFDLKEILEENPINPNMKARIVSWEETSIPEIIKENNPNQIQRKYSKKRASNLPDSNITKKGRSK